MLESKMSSNLSLGIVSAPPVKPVGGNSGKESMPGNPRRGGRSRKMMEDEGDSADVPETPPHQIDKLA